MAKKIDFLISYANAPKEIVSGLELLPQVGQLIIENYGEHIRLGGMDRVRFPYHLDRDELALLRLVDRGSKQVEGVAVRFFFAQMIGVRSKRVVMRCSFAFTEPDM
ncbi:MAG TPA: hypothetical protein VJZ94_03565 [Candidatus Paceibacterota bacterium]|uniref:Uncharacterized protein n=1 Tax=Candidatus Adlerbacteria bacterium RIFCSPHIGHO2_12_FULL_53_18 TaxID=1797242 RepID=A0A1F4XSQ8_9BACT|nr:MAG: hypothetical protein A3F55_03175 [Candidatus Adlerbacteria bacterium RIFCSPHIGHO2_12_FULL_53_18]HXK31770.1 hypothetical protein [Candidatus Paceibacterota bacterium]